MILAQTVTIIIRPSGIALNCPFAIYLTDLINEKYTTAAMDTAKSVIV